MSFVYEASYIDLMCDSDDIVSDFNKQIPQTIGSETNNIDCLANGTCTLRTVQTSNCQMRSKRSAEQETAGFEIEITCNSRICKYEYHFCKNKHIPVYH